ncbi:MAG: hypothetical protein ABS76_16070 [Pelagibacterium sp. SCN 64-44]|nr:MAG: hypothetical protein ABS76_16070 [Pelagibacterium sp. SCN 64-44]
MIQDIPYPAAAPDQSFRAPPALARTFALLKTAVLAAEIVVISFLLLARIDILTALAVHFGLGGMLLATILIVERLGYSAGTLQSYTLQMLVAGPMGSASALIGEQLASRAKAEELVQWYETIAPTPQSMVTLADRIIDDQLVRPHSKLPQNVNHLIAQGSMREKQALFASIVSEARVEGVGLIEKALRSRDQRVRVQAAAVSAFIRSKLRNTSGVAAGTMKRDADRLFVSNRDKPAN